jgi:hypothetical protein
MQQLYLTRRNLLTLLSKLDRAKAGEETFRTIVKTDVQHPAYPCSDVIRITAIEDADYYTDREPGPMHELDEQVVDRERAFEMGGFIR